MVQFNKDSFTIEVETAGNPIEDWLSTHDELIDVLQCSNTEMTAGRNFQFLLELIRSMMPDWETAKKMID